MHKCIMLTISAIIKHESHLQLATLILNNRDQQPQVRAFDKEMVNPNVDITEITLIEANAFSCILTHNDTLNKVWRTTQ